jgi:hypothetical protein
MCYTEPKRKTKMNIPMNPLMIASALCMGALSAFFAYKRGRNPYIWFAVGFLFGIFGICAIFFTSGKKKAPQPLKQAPIFSIQGPKDKFWYYLDPTNQQQGPLSLDGLTKEWREGKVDLATLIWHEDLAEWQPLKNCVREGGF